MENGVCDGRHPGEEDTGVLDSHRYGRDSYHEICFKEIPFGFTYTKSDESLRKGFVSIPVVVVETLVGRASTAERQTNPLGDEGTSTCTPTHHGPNLGGRASRAMMGVLQKHSQHEPWDRGRLMDSMSMSVLSLDIILFSIAPKAKPTPTLRHSPQHSIFEPHGHNYLVWVLSPADAVSLRFSGSVSTKWRPCLCLCAFREPFKSVEIPRMELTSFLTLDFQWLRAGLVALKTPRNPFH